MTDPTQIHAGWPQPPAHGEPLARGVLRARQEDFVVDEIPNWAPTGDGEHDVLWVEKRGANTRWVAGALARHAGCRAADVGYAGLKDRHAVTRQWFSVARAGRCPDWQAFEADGVRILEVAAHRRKLRPGALSGNRFRILVAAACPEAPALPARVAAVRAQGVPNYFGPQRFGRDGGNLALAGRLAAGERLGRGQRGFALSAARSALFNAVLAERVRRGDWLQPQVGDALMLTGSNSFFVVDDSGELDALAARAAEGDLQPTGPLWGEGESAVTGDVATLEARIGAVLPELVAATTAARAKPARRALRVFADGLEASSSSDGLMLAFTLPAGSFATAVVNEFVALDQ